MSSIGQITSYALKFQGEIHLSIPDTSKGQKQLGIRVGLSERNHRYATHVRTCALGQKRVSALYSPSQTLVYFPRYTKLTTHRRRGSVALSSTATLTLPTTPVARVDQRFRCLSSTKPLTSRSRTPSCMMQLVTLTSST